MQFVLLVIVNTRSVLVSVNVCYLLLAPTSSLLVANNTNKRVKVVKKNYETIQVSGTSFLGNNNSQSLLVLCVFISSSY